MKLALFAFVLLLCAVVNARSNFESRVQQVVADNEEYKPIELHIAFSNGLANELIVTCHTKDYDEKLLGKPMVKYSTTDKTLSKNYQVASVGGVISQYGEVSHTGFDMAVRLSNLQYSTKYYYQVSFTLNSNVSSDIFYFYTRTDPKSSASYETTVVMYGDQGVMRSSNDIAQVEKFVHSFLDTSSNKNLFIYHLGDISYGR